ncbi:hypothetical protein GCM10011515_16140 [Tsuneonella deserti]|uniref:Transferrin-binding protein B C-lobe/N-lobe beta barrel domain-containing protein n=1 Tax=Tsuneonella deserti TaxID=2035528 RepID=A0ABQ1SAI3_9SPHN|nr:hypothetical protein [Tsuneonella deserti]GGD97120.1 hypothetical protein GCM10011515_16140 [Tsuneonella deserti]
MRSKFVNLAGAAALSLMLASCFGGGDSSPTPSPTPTPTPSPTPTPTPTPTAVVFDFTKAFTANAANTSYSYAYFTPTGGAETWSDGSRRDGASKITYTVSPESAQFAWPDNATLTSFGAADLKTAEATRRAYRKGTDGLVMELPFHHVLRVTYESTQPFVLDTKSGTLHGFRVSLFFNPVTATGDITADRAYSGTAQVAGGKTGVTPPGVFTAEPGTLTLTASTKKIAGTIRVFETVNGSPVLRAVLPISATIGTGGAFAGDINDATNGFKGKFVGTLAGPGREEVVLIFNVAHTDGRELIGSLIGG